MKKVIEYNGEMYEVEGVKAIYTGEGRSENEEEQNAVLVHCVSDEFSDGDEIYMDCDINDIEASDDLESVFNLYPCKYFELKNGVYHVNG